MILSWWLYMRCNYRFKYPAYAQLAGNGWINWTYKFLTLCSGIRSEIQGCWLEYFFRPPPSGLYSQPQSITPEKQFSRIKTFFLSFSFFLHWLLWHRSNLAAGKKGGNHKHLVSNCARWIYKAEQENKKKCVLPSLICNTLPRVNVCGEPTSGQAHNVFCHLLNMGGSDRAWPAVFLQPLGPLIALRVTKQHRGVRPFYSSRCTTVPTLIVHDVRHIPRR